MIFYYNSDVIRVKSFNIKRYQYIGISIMWSIIFELLKLPEILRKLSRFQFIKKGRIVPMFSILYVVFTFWKAKKTLNHFFLFLGTQRRYLSRLLFSMFIIARCYSQRMDFFHFEDTLLFSWNKLKGSVRSASP